MLKKSLTTAVFLCVLTVAGAQDVPPGMTMHRSQVGVFDKEGWALAESTEGKFSVKLPCKFNDFTTDDPSPTAVVVRTYTVGCLHENQEKFAAVRLQYRGGATAAKNYFEQSLGGAGWQPQDEIKRAKFGKHPALDIVTHQPPRCGFVRMILLDSDVIFLAAEAPLPPCEELRAHSQKFFASLSTDGH
jgi:hypothetical protein